MDGGRTRENETEGRKGEKFGGGWAAWEAGRHREEKAGDEAYQERNEETESQEAGRM